MQQHQREQPEHLGLVGHQRRQHAGEADRLPAQVAAHELVRAGRRVALVEDQVERRQHGAQPVRQLVVGRHHVRDVRGLDLALGPHQPLRHRRLRDEERARDLGRRQPAEGAQRERHLRLGRERGMAAGEDQPQAVVGDRHAVLLVVRLLRWRPQRLEPRQDRRLLGEALRTAHAVDRLVACGRRDPGPGVVRHAVARPPLERLDETHPAPPPPRGRSPRSPGSGWRPPVPTRAGTGGRRILRWRLDRATSPPLPRLRPAWPRSPSPAAPRPHLAARRGSWRPSRAPRRGPCSRAGRTRPAAPSSPRRGRRSGSARRRAPGRWWPSRWAAGPRPRRGRPPPRSPGRRRRRRPSSP